MYTEYNTSTYKVARSQAKKSQAKKAKAWWNSLDGSSRALMKKRSNLSNDAAIERYWLANVSMDHLGADNGS